MDTLFRYLSSTPLFNDDETYLLYNPKNDKKERLSREQGLDKSKSLRICRLIDFELIFEDGGFLLACA